MDRMDYAGAGNGSGARNMTGGTNWGSAFVIGLVVLIVIAAAYYFMTTPWDARDIVVGGRTPMLNSEIAFYVLNADGSKGMLAGNTTSDEDGIYVTSVSAAPGDFVLVEATGGAYADGISRATPLRASDRITAAISAEDNETWATITPLTHMAAARAVVLAANGTELSVAVPSANNGVARQYGLIDITWNLPVLADDEEAVRRADIDERSYSLVLAGISEEAETLGVTTMELTEALAEDAGDGLLDGRNGTGQVTMQTQAGAIVPLQPDAGTNGVQNGIRTAPVAPNLGTNQANAAIPLQPVELGINGAGKFYVTSTMLPAAIAGDDYEYQLMALGGFPPHTCGLRVQNADSTLSALPQWLQLGNNCVLRGQVPLFAGGTTMSISQPFTVSMCDRTGTCSVFELRLTTVGKAPQIVTETTTCFVNEPCRFGIATASGGVPPYYYRSDYLRHGAPPMGTIVDLNGDISGTPSRTGTYNVGVCVIDLIGAYSCDTATVIVIPREVRLYIYKSGDGSGKINVNPYSDGLVYPYGTVVTVSGRPDAGSTFVGWQGICEEAGTHDCSITMTGDRKVTAEFAGNAAPPPSDCGTGHHLSDCGNGQTRCCMSNMECCRGDCRPVGWCD